MVNEGFSIRRLMEEIAKCDVRCRNCHAIVTLERAGENWRSRAMQDATVKPMARACELPSG